MGWTTERAYHFKRNGEIDRKAECDRLYTGHSENGTWEVLKSSMVGSTYYCACKRTKPDGTSYVFAGICLTTTAENCSEYFSYKDMSENSGPYYYDCPKSILDLLSPTDNEYALNWREQCNQKRLEKAAERKDKSGLKNLPLGTKISINDDGNTVTLVKSHCINYKLPKWIDWDKRVFYGEDSIKRMGYAIIA